MTCSTCGHENPSGNRFCGHCGGSLNRCCPACGCDNPPAHRFCGACGGALDPVPIEKSPPRQPLAYTPKHLADKILQSRAALEGERKQVTVMFADIQGSMDLAIQLDAENWHQLLDGYFSVLTRAVHRYEGTVNQYTGDGIMALFGAPIAHEDHAQRACYAALEARDELLRYADARRISHGINFGARLGLNSGEVVVGRIGDDLRMDYTAQGSTVGIAQRIEQVAPAGHIYVSGTTQHLVDGYFQLRAVGETRLKGIPEPVALFELQRPGNSRTRLDIAIARGLTPFVGRHPEMQILESALARAVEGHGQVVGVVGDPGQGKSRLCFEFVRQCRARGITVIEGRCPAHGRNIPFLPILEIFRAFFGIVLTDSAEVARQKIAGSLVLLDPALADRMPALFEFMGVSDTKHLAPPLDGDLRQRQLFEIMHRVYRALATEHKLVVTLIDDLHWIDPGSDAFVAQMVTATATSHSLLLLNFRPEYVATFEHKTHYQQLPLIPLGTEAAQELIASLIGKDQSVDALTARIVEWTGGNPFYTEELILSLIETGHLRGKPGNYLLMTDLSRLDVPVNVQTVLAARIDRLPEAAKRLLQSAAVIGLVFPASTMSAISELSTLDQTQVLEVLQMNDFIYEHAQYPRLEYAFKHPLTQEVAYRSLLQSRRQALHSSVARALETEDETKLDELAALIAHHWDQASELAPAIGWHYRAAKHTGIADQLAARRHWARVREIAERLPSDLKTMAMGTEACAQYIQLGFRLEGARADTEAMFQAGLRFGTQAEAPALLAVLYAAYGANIGLAFGDMRHYLQHTEQAERLGAAAAEDPSALAAVRFFRMDALTWAGDFAGASRIASELRHSLAGDTQTGISAIGLSTYINATNHLGIAQMFMGELAPGRSHLEEGTRLAQETGDAESALWPTVWLCYLAALRGDRTGAERHAIIVTDLGRHLDTAMTRLLTAFCVGLSHLAAQRWAEAQNVLEEAYRFGHACHCGMVCSPEILSALAEAHFHAGDLVAAERYATEAVEFCVANALLHCAAPWIIRARVRIAKHAAASAGEDLDTAADLIAKTGARLYLAPLHTARADYAAAFGGRWQRVSELATAREFYVRLDAPARVAEIDELLT